MATQVTAYLELKAVVSTSNSLDLETANSSLSRSWVNSLTNGANAINKADQAFSDKRTLAAGASESFDLFDLGGLKDAVGNVVAITKLKGLIIYNKSIVAGDKLKIGGLGTSATFTSLFDGSNSSKFVLGPDGIFLTTDPSAAALAVADATNHLLQISNPGPNSIDYEIVILGTTT